MTKFERAYIPPGEIRKAADDLMKMFDHGQGEELLKQLDLPPNATRAEAMARIDGAIRKATSDEIWRNDLYQVSIYRWDEPLPTWPKMIHLSIKRNDRAPIHDWRDLQEIKNQLIGSEHEAVELYPAESRRVDSANQYHLWILETSGIRFPFGFDTRFVVDHIPGTTAQQRPLEKEEA